MTDFRLYGIFGFPLAHTLSPVMQEAAFRSAGLKAFYLPFEVRAGEFRRLLRERRRLLLDGFNVTVPYKEAALALLDRVHPSARAIGAVNTVVRKGKEWMGFNTDAAGFITALERRARFRVRGKKVLLLGGGGSARAVAYGLAKRGARSIVIANRTVSRARKIANDFRRLFPQVRWCASPLLRGKDVFVGAGFPRPVCGRGNRAPTDKSICDIDLVVNATSVGLKPGDPSLVRTSLFPKKTLFADLIYRPAETPFLQQARRSGRRTMNGIEMLLYQGAEAFRLWTGKRAPIEVMRDALSNVIAGRQSERGRRGTTRRAPTFFPQ